MSLDEELRELVREIVREEIAAVERPSRWVPAKEAGRILGISAAGVGNRVRRGTLAGRLYRRRIYVDREALDAEIASATLPGVSFKLTPTKRPGELSTPRP